MVQLAHHLVNAENALDLKERECIMIHMIMLAAGESRRFGGNKLLCDFEGKQLYRHVFDKLLKLKEIRNDLLLCVVTQYEEIRSYANTCGIWAIWNDHAYEGITSSLKLGIECVGKTGAQDYYAFFVSDQPYLNLETVQKFFKAFLESGYSIGCVRAEEQKGNPTIFHVKYRNELLNLTGDVGGKQLFSKYPEECFYYEMESKIELVDYDEKW